MQLNLSPRLVVWCNILQTRNASCNSAALCLCKGKRTFKCSNTFEMLNCDKCSVYLGSRLAIARKTFLFKITVLRVILLGDAISESFTEFVAELTATTGDFDFVLLNTQITQVATEEPSRM